MIMIPDQVTRKKLILIKQIYQRATILSNIEHSIIDRIMALIAFDLTVESVLKTTISSLDVTKTPSDSFQGLIQQANDLLGKRHMGPVPDQAHIQHVHSLRNDAQHKAKYPIKSDLDDCRIYIRDFLKTFVNNVYKIDFEAISQAELINNQEIKQHITDAETHFKNGDYQKSSEWANVGLESAVNHAGHPYVGSSAEHMFGEMTVTNHRGESEGNRDITQAFKRIQNTVRHIALGLDYSDKIRFNKIAGFVQLTLTGDHSMYNMKENISKDEAEFVLSFAIDAIIRIENRVGDLEAPFGQQYWW